MLDNDSSYFCEKCACKRRATKRILLHKLPRVCGEGRDIIAWLCHHVLRPVLQVFILHLNRARWLLHGKKEKLQNHVVVCSPFPLHPFISIVLHVGCVCVPLPWWQFPMAGWDVAHFTGGDGDVGCVYDLVALVCHHGKGIDTGHYTTYCKDVQRGVCFDCLCECSLLSVRVRMGARVLGVGGYLMCIPHCLPLSSDVWLWFDDDKVKVSSPADVLGSQAYLLFYQQR